MKKALWIVGCCLLALVVVEQTRAQVVSQAPATPVVAPQTAAVPVGPTLDVIPHVSADGYTIQMNVIPTTIEFLGYEDPGEFQTQVGQQTAVLPLPRFRVRQITTSTIVWDGQTIVMGGLISESIQKIKDKVPVLGDIPIVGRLFRSEATHKQKKNLVIFVTPTIIDPAGNRIHAEDNLPYDPNKLPDQIPFAPN